MRDDASCEINRLTFCVSRPGIIAVNLTAPMMVTKLGVNHMLEKQIKGSIINIGSVAALRGFAAGK
jgi:NAD(P)-dependent dehydrogenase (short-subunit alcohol dehydrogenase family)